MWGWRGGRGDGKGRGKGGVGWVGEWVLGGKVALEGEEIGREGCGGRVWGLGRGGGRWFGGGG